MTPPQNPSEENGHDLSDRELLIRIHERVKAIPDHEERIRALETTKNWLIGAWAVVSSLFGFHTFGGHK